MNLYKILCFFGWHFRRIDLSSGCRKGSWAWWKCVDCGHEDTDWYNM